MSERRHHQPLRRDWLAVDAPHGTFLDPAERPVVAGLDRPQHRPSGRVVAKQGQHPEGLLGGERQVVGDAHCRWSSSFEELGQVLTGDQPAALRAPMRFQVRPARLPTRGDRLGDLHRVVLVVTGNSAQVAVGHTGEAGCVADRQLILGATEGTDLLGCHALVTGLLAAGQLFLAHPSGPVLIDQRDQVRRAGLGLGSANRMTNGISG